MDSQPEPEEVDEQLPNAAEPAAAS
jgi:hypothetical protein